MKSSIHGIVSPVPLSAALTVMDGQPSQKGRKIKYSTILKQEQAAKKNTPKPNVFRFGTMFPQLADQRLPDTPGIAQKLFNLAQSMKDGSAPRERNSKIPAVYTYLGQFIDHDITKTEVLTPELGSNMEAAFHAVANGFNVSPLELDQIPLLVNKRVPTLNLDSVLSSAAPRDPKGALAVGTVTVAGAPPRPTLPFAEPADLADLHDLPRQPPTATNEDLDRRARIGDPRNDENLVVAQLHVAFLRAHRRLVHEQGLSPKDADTELQRLYQSMVVTDFLPTVCDRMVVDAVLSKAAGVFYKPTAHDPFMPLEFSVAAFRFGHSMVRDAYNYNSEFSGKGGKPIATLKDLFTFTAFSGNNFGLPTLPQNWIIDWSRWLPAADGTLLNSAKQVDTLLASMLSDLPQHQGVIGGDDVNILAVRNLVRGYLLRLPTGQAVAQAAKAALGGVVEPLTPKQIRDVAAAADAIQPPGAPIKQLDAVTAAEFDKRTPLWYYMLAEAAHVQNEGGHLGPVASVIIADVLIQLCRLTEANYLAVPSWKPKIPTSAPAASRKVTLPDFLRFAQVMP